MKVFIMTALLFSTSLFAQDRSAPCKADIKNFCSAVSGRKNIVSCLRQNQKDLSPSCSMQFKAAKEAMNDCKADMKKYCKGKGPGKGEMLSCLKENKASLNPACKTRVEGQ